MPGCLRGKAELGKGAKDVRANQLTSLSPGTEEVQTFLLTCCEVQTPSSAGWGDSAGASEWGEEGGPALSSPSLPPYPPPVLQL